MNTYERTIWQWFNKLTFSAFKRVDAVKRSTKMPLFPWRRLAVTVTASAIVSKRQLLERGMVTVMKMSAPALANKTAPPSFNVAFPAFVRWAFPASICSVHLARLADILKLSLKKS